MAVNNRSPGRRTASRGADEGNLARFERLSVHRDFAFHGSPIEAASTAAERNENSCHHNPGQHAISLAASQKSAGASPPLGEPSACHVARLILLVMKRPEPSARTTCTPLGWTLRAETMFLRLL